MNPIGLGSHYLNAYTKGTACTRCLPISQDDLRRNKQLEAGQLTQKEIWPGTTLGGQARRGYRGIVTVLLSTLPVS